MGHIEIVGLWARRRNVRAACLLNVLFAFRYAVVVVANTDNFRHAAEKSGKRFNYGWRKFHSPLLARDVRRIWIAHEPFGVGVKPHVQTMVLDGFNHFFRHGDWQNLLVYDRFKIRLNQDSAIECGKRLSESHWIDQHRHAPWRPPARDAKLNSSFVQPRDGLGRAFR